MTPEDTSGDADIAAASYDSTESEHDADFDGPWLSLSFDAISSNASGTKQGPTTRSSQHSIFVEACKARDASVEQLCKDDGAFYARDVVIEGVDGNFKSLKDFTAHVHNAKCTKCYQKYFVSPRVITDVFRNWSEGSGARLSPEFTCSHCNVTACPFCERKGPKEFSWVRTHGKEVSWCCSTSRLFLIWIILCAFDERYHPTEDSTAEESSAEKSPTAPQESGNDCAAKSLLDKTSEMQNRIAESNYARRQGVGFGGSARPYDPLHPFDGLDDDDGLSRAQKAQIDEDTFGNMVLSLLVSLLPGLSRVTNFDYKPPKAISTLLLNSKILEYSAALLRNGSLDDVLVRQAVYRELFTFVTSLCEHHATSQLVYMDRLVRSDGINLISLSFQATSSSTEEKRESVFKLLRNLAMQSDLLVQRAHEQDFSTQDGQTLMKISRRIKELWDLLSVNNPERSGISKNSDGAAVNSNVDPITDLPDDQIMASHYCANQIRELRDTPRGRMKKILTDIAILRTGLPQGIYVRFSSERPDVMKTLIIGPEGTPYENGVFEFDISCPFNYPNEPPKVTFRTTGEGRVNFNPNLYSNGKVCLSLLGTWSGEPWDPAQSTLLQVLVSIQAMILCEDPWYNEPGRDAKDTLHSTAYNKMIRALTVEHAILGYTDLQLPLWSDVITHHFSQKGDKILQTMQAWTESEVDPQPKFASHYWMRLETAAKPLVAMQKQLQDAMRKFGSTFELRIIDPPRTIESPPRPRAWPPMESVGYLLDDIPVFPSDQASNQKPSWGSFGAGGSLGHNGTDSNGRGTGSGTSRGDSQVSSHGGSIFSIAGSDSSLGHAMISHTPHIISYRGRGETTRGTRASGWLFSGFGRGSDSTSPNLEPQGRGGFRGGFGSRGADHRGGRGSSPAPGAGPTDMPLPESEPTTGRGRGEPRGRGSPRRGGRGRGRRRGSQ